MASKRIKWLDIMKGIGALLVLLGHLVGNGKLKVFIYSFHMPLFFIIAGYCFHYKKDIKNFLNIKIRRFIIPYICFTVLSFFICLFIDHIQFTWIEFLKNITFYHSHNQYNSSLWFLIVMFESLLIFELLIFAVNKMKNDRLIKKLFPVLTIIFIFLQQHYNILLPFGFSLIPHCLLLIYIGYILKNKDIVRTLKYENKLLLITFPLGILGALYNGQISISANVYNNYLIYIVVALANTFNVMALARRVNKSKILDMCCQMSVFMFCTQRLLFKLYYIVENKIGHTIVNSANYFVVILTLVITLLIYYIIYNCITKIKKYLLVKYKIRM